MKTNKHTCRNCEQTLYSANYGHECQNCQNELRQALEVILADLTWYNAHTIAALLENHYKNNYDNEKAMEAYKAAQWELFGTQ